MTQRLFLEGPSGSGKTTLLLKELGTLNRSAGGFVSLRLVDQERRTRAFSLTPPPLATSSVLPYSEDVPNIFLEHTRKGTAWHIEVFENVGMELLINSAKKKLILLDEIGGCELLSDTFSQRLLELLEGCVPCIGVLKSAENAENMARRLALPAGYIQRYRAFRRRLLSNSSVLSLPFSQDTRVRAIRSVKDFLSPFVPRSSEADS